MSDSQPAPPNRAVFVSYAREDTASALRIADALRAFGVEVWFDQSELRGGDTWDSKIKKQIRECALFVPLISAQTQERTEGYFRREWLLAVERLRDMAHGVAFIVPVVIDETREADAAVPEEFMRFHWTRLAHGVPSPQFVEQVKKLLEAPRKPVANTRPTVVASTGAAPRSSGFPMWLTAIVGIALLGAVAFLAMRPATKEPAAPPKPIAETKLASLSPLAPSPAPATATTAADEKSVAVLAFADLSEARNSEYFSDGISEELLNVLAKVPGLRVAARTSAFYFKGKNLPIPEIAAKLNVAYVVEGSVQRAGERVKITAQLIKAADGFHVWSDTFTRDAKDVFAVQEEIAGRIAKELSLKLGVSSAASTAAVNPQALELYLRARQAWSLRSAEGFARAEETLNQAIALEPTFARASALLALTWSVRDSAAGVIGKFGQRQSEAVKRIQAPIDRALALEPNLAEAHTAQGNLHWNRWQLDEAAREARLAIAQNPNDATAHQVLGRVLMSDGRIDEATAALKRATELDPLSHRILDNYSSVLRFAGRFEEALAADDRAHALQPDALQASVWRTLDLSGLGRHEEAVALLRQLPVANTSYAAWSLDVFVKAGQRAEAEQRLASIPADFKYEALAVLGRPEAALAAIDPTTLAIQPFHDLLLDPSYDPLRTDPRFVKILATLGMTEAHARAQAWRAAHPPEKPAAKK